MLTGFAFGLAQDTLHLIQGQRLAYVEWLGRFTGLSDGQQIQSSRET